MRDTLLGPAPGDAHDTRTVTTVRPSTRTYVQYPIKTETKWSHSRNHPIESLYFLSSFCFRKDTIILGVHQLKYLIYV